MLRARQLAALTLTVTVTIVAAACDARAAEVAVHFGPGVLVARGFPEIHTKATVDGDLTIWWSLTRRFDLGLASGLAATTFLYSSNDGEPVLGQRGADSWNTHEELTALPRMMLGSRIGLPADTTIGLFVGAAHVLSDALGNFSVIPYPIGSVEVETRFGTSGRYGVRLAFSYMSFVEFHSERSFTTATLAFACGS